MDKMTQASANQSRISKAVTACALFVAANVMVSLCLKLDRQDIFQQQNRTEAWWTVDHFNGLHHHIDLLLLGSSLMCRIINEGEATYAHKILNGHDHYRCQNLEDALGHELKKNIKTASLAVPGLNGSDASVLGCELLQGDKKPDVIVYGIAPRDLMDNALESPAGTDVFHLMERTGDLSSVAYAARPTRESKMQLFANQLLSRFLPAYKYQEELTTLFRRSAGALLTTYLPAPALGTMPPVDRAMRVAMRLLSPDSDADLKIYPYDPQHLEHFDFRNCYAAAYNPFRPKLYRTQVNFVDRFLQVAQERGIKVVLVNMPLRQDSFELMPPNFYNIYGQDVRKLAATRGATFIDMQPMAFDDVDFVDQVHLSGLGACKFIERLAPRVANVMNGSVVARSANSPIDLSTTSTRSAY